MWHHWRCTFVGPPRQHSLIFSPPSSLLISWYQCSLGFYSEHFPRCSNSPCKSQTTLSYLVHSDDQQSSSSISLSWALHECIQHLPLARLSLQPHPAFLVPVYSNLCTVTAFLYSHPCVSVPKMTSVSPRLPFPVLPSFFKMLLASPSSGSIPPNHKPELGFHSLILAPLSSVLPLWQHLSK